ncbi:MAG: type II toxin-antitoxin system VapC family toxin [Acidimicrobiaceae bacterium]|nr:type II toxin-antitoxin system VapC family toxin [Acidimicrobiaceae bacterium]MYD06453.1 type II toxin-antitoxin system VapC family toxin [Acidimicrobiaceae bacterium]MYI57883.1 type II toxin-antitoxin system VapC family toxin [Acidimicrobiaceae bacterium]
MRYWDASALVPLVVSEPGTEQARSWLADDDQIVTWGWTRVEIVSAIERLTREQRLDRMQRREALARLDTFADTWDEVCELLTVRDRARRLLARYPLRAADAGQLGAATLVQDQISGPLVFLSLDRRQSEAAELEGLMVL